MQVNNEWDTCVSWETFHAIIIGFAEVDTFNKQYSMQEMCMCLSVCVDFACIREAIDYLFIK